MPLIPGSLFPSDASRTEYANSMAKAMEEAFKNEWPNAMGEGKDAPESNNQMRLMFVAVAQGIVKHLQSHPEAFVVSDSPGTTVVPEHLAHIK